MIKGKRTFKNNWLKRVFTWESDFTGIVVSQNDILCTYTLHYVLNQLVFCHPASESDSSSPSSIKAATVEYSNWDVR